MTDLLDWAITAHGGLDSWNALRTISLDLSVGGALWEAKGQAGLFANATYAADIYRQRATVGQFGAPDRRVQFTPDKLVLETEDGDVLEIRDNPRAAFAGHTKDTPWDPLHEAYFDGYALWTYLTQPFLYRYPGFLATDIEPWDEDGEVWRRLKVRFPDGIASHTREQVSYFGPDGRLRRHDCAVDVLGGATGAHYIGDYREHGGIMVPYRRRVYPLGADNLNIPEHVLITIDIARVDFQPA